MTNPAYSAIFVTLTLASIAAWLVSLRYYAKSSEASKATKTPILQNSLVLLTALASTITFLINWANSPAHQPITSHVDGLLIVASLFAFVILFIQSRPALRGLSAFSLPLLALLYAWCICASSWSYKPFDLEQLKTLWLPIHLLCVYLGTLFAALASMTGLMYLFIQSRLKHKTPTTLKTLGRFASLETLERLIIISATSSFALFTIGLVTGLVIITSNHATLSAEDSVFWLIPKIILATIAWLLYAIIMNVRHATSFRGSRAAWLSVLGFVLLLAVYSIVIAMPTHQPQTQSADTTTTPPLITTTSTQNGGA